MHKAAALQAGASQPQPESDSDFGQGAHPTHAGQSFDHFGAGADGYHGHNPEIERLIDQLKDALAQEHAADGGQHHPAAGATHGTGPWGWDHVEMSADHSGWQTLDDSPADLDHDFGHGSAAHETGDDAAVHHVAF